VQPRVNEGTVLSTARTVIVSEVVVPIERRVVRLTASRQTPIRILVRLCVEIAREDLLGEDGGERNKREGRDLEVSLTVVQGVVPDRFDRFISGFRGEATRGSW
jgi:hypothetical protein